MFRFWFASRQQMEEKRWRWKLSVCVCLCVYITGVLADFTTLLKHCHFKTLVRDVWMSEHVDTRANVSSLPSHHRLKLGQELCILINWPPFLYHVQGALINFITSQSTWEIGIIRSQADVLCGVPGPCEGKAFCRWEKVALQHAVNAVKRWILTQNTCCKT